jgi:membrane-associated protease RseP (regulator of RpoE activity)
MRPSLASSSALALVLTLSQATGSVAQQSQEKPNPQGKPAVERDALLQAAENLKLQQALVRTPVLFRELTFDPLQNLTFGWVDDASRTSGMTLAPADAALRAHLSLPKEEGLIVTALDPGSPAAQAGIHQNDVLIRLGDEESRSIPLAKPDDLEGGLKAAGDHPVSLVLLRTGQKATVKVQPRFKVSLGPVSPQLPAYWIGVSAAPVEPALRTQLQIPADQGLMIVEVHKDSPAVKAGIQRYDIFLKWDGVNLSDQASLTKFVQSRAEKPAKVEVLRKGHKQEITITPQRRVTAITLQVSGPRAVQFDVVQPGAIFSGADPGAEVLNRLRKELEHSSVTLHQTVANQQGHSAQGKTPSGKSVEQRLDDLSSQLKELSQAIEALAKAQEKK